MTEQYIVCPECGNTISRFYRFFDAAKQAYYAEHLFNNKELKDYDPSKLFFIHGNNVDLRTIFKALNIQNICCKTHLVSKTIISNMPTKLN